MQINSNIELNEHTQGIQDIHGKKEIEANKLAKRIFWKYGYDPIKIHNYDDHLFENKSSLYEGTDHGIDDVIYIQEIPKHDPLKLKSLSRGRFDHTCYTIDYKSNNFSGDDNSIYVKLMKYIRPQHYLKEINIKGKTVNLENHYIKKDRERCKIAREEGRKTIRSSIDEYYNNNFLLADNNKTDYFLYLKYDERDYFYLTQAYLIQANKLRYQIIGLLNDILDIGDSNKRIKLNDSYLNNRISDALSIADKTNNLSNNNDLELFKSKKDVILRIPEDILTSYIKFDNEGEIITMTT